MFEQILQLVKEHLGNNPQVAAAIPAEKADAVHEEIATHITNGLQGQQAVSDSGGGFLSNITSSLGNLGGGLGNLGGGNLLTTALEGGLVSSLASKLGLPPAATGAIAAALPGLLQKIMHKTGNTAN